MPTANTEQHARAELRVTAEERLNRGSAPATRGGSTGAPALASLHRLANAPASASDALKLLHELQVHQVELDLQHEQAEQNCRQLAQELSRQAALFDDAPFACLTLTLNGKVIEFNRAGAELFGLEAGPIANRPLRELLGLEGSADVLELLKRLRAGSTKNTCSVQPVGRANRLHVVARLSPAAGACLLGFMPIAQAPAY